MGSEPRFRNLLRSKRMFDMIKFAIKAAATDRKGVTALEYTVIASAIIVVCIGGFQLIGTNLNTVLGTVGAAIK